MDACMCAINGWMDGCMDGWINGWMDRCMDRQTDGLMDAWMDKLTDGQIDARIHYMHLTMLRTVRTYVVIFSWP